jgi:hypothetical protein
MIYDSSFHILHYLSLSMFVSFSSSLYTRFTSSLASLFRRLLGLLSLRMGP